MSKGHSLARSAWKASIVKVKSTVKGMSTVKGKSWSSRKANRVGKKMHQRPKGMVIATMMSKILRLPVPQDSLQWAIHMLPDRVQLEHLVLMEPLEQLDSQDNQDSQGTQVNRDNPDSQGMQVNQDNLDSQSMQVNQDSQDNPDSQDSQGMQDNPDS